MKTIKSLTYHNCICFNMRIRLFEVGKEFFNRNEYMTKTNVLISKGNLISRSF